MSVELSLKLTILICSILHIFHDFLTSPGVRFFKECGGATLSLVLLPLFSLLQLAKGFTEILFLNINETV